ncbi:MAG: M12 family metallo-peptidase [Nibricoccus sp.]
MKKTHRIKKAAVILSAMTVVLALALVLGRFVSGGASSEKISADRTAAVIRSKDHLPTLENLSAPANLPAARGEGYSQTVSEVFPGLTQPVSNWREFKPKQISISPYPDTTFTFNQTGMRESSDRTEWTGRNSLQGAFMVTSATEKEWHGVVAVPGGSSFDVHISGDKVVVKEQSPEVHCGNLSAPKDAQKPQASLAGTIAADLPSADLASVGSGVAVVDVEVFYNASALAEAGSVDAIATRASADIAYANMCAAQSGVNVRWNYLGCAQVPGYAETGNMADDLNHIESFNASRSGIADPVAQFAYDKCAAVGADQGVFYVGGNRSGVWGVAYTVDFAGTPYHYACVLWNSDHTVFAHEAAHNFGCHHDRATEASSSIGAYDGDGRYFYGHRFSYNGSDCGDVMSYAANRWPYYSNPGVSANGVQMGLPMNDPRAAYNVAVINSRAAMMANYRLGTTTSLPVITGQPQSASVSLGSYSVLTVAAAGSNLNYQWYFNGVPVSGATDPVMGAALAGTYYVVVSNAGGSAVSSTAVVDVNTGVSSSLSSSVSSVSTPTGGSSTSGSGWRFLKFQVDQLDLENGWIPIFQMSEFKLYSQSNAVNWPAGTTVTALHDGAASPASESPSNLIDSNAQTKYCEVGNAGNTTILFTLGQPMTNIDAFSMVNGNDTQSYTNRVPRGWKLYASEDGLSWKLLASASNWTPSTYANYAEQQRNSF